MRKTIATVTLVFGLMAGFAYATPSNYSFNNYDNMYTKTFKVNVFCKSIAKGEFETVKKMVSLGEDVNQKSNGMTPLMYAARYNRVDILKFLVKKGADVKTRCDRNRFTALKYAKLSNATEAVDLLETLMSKKSS